MPDINYHLGEMYGGLIPINKSDPSRQLYHIFKPAIDGPQDEITIYLNGGPGCSSLDSFLQETGPYLWQPGTFLPVPNPYSWANITNMLWVDQPVGTGFSIGKVTATSEYDIAAEFVEWFKNFELLYDVTGESYAGRYVPYISSAMLNKSDTEYYDLKGALVYDPCIGNYLYTQEEVVTYPFLEKNNGILGLNASFMANLSAAHSSCGYQNIIDTYYRFPPPGNQPPMVWNASAHPECDVFDNAYGALLEINPCFDIYEINQQCPLLWDVLSFPTGLMYTPEGATTYFNQTNVKEAIHAPVYVDWMICGEHRVFVGKEPGPELNHDDAPDPIQSILPQVIEATNRVLIGNGDLGTLLSIQNMTWHGKLGFQYEPNEPIYISMSDYQYNQTFFANGAEGIDGPQGTMGIQHYERGLMFVETYLSGHMEPEFQPRVSLQHIKWLLGRIEKL
ncbi:hypothetical protein M433DRAFT_24189 [Acidomyces richmondensis BFW]|nr:hypothetical protein M433DRAFT_24189 [Acidomyces richmondensis BFW]